MQISVHGRDNAAAQRGFTLLEMLVVLVIIGVITSAAGLAVVSGQSSRGLTLDAQRLTHLFALAQADARAWGQAVRWSYDNRSYGFTRVPVADAPVASELRLQLPPAPSQLYQNGPLRQRPWSGESAVQVQVIPAGAVVFTADWLSGPAHLVLTDGRHTVRIARSAMGVYTVHP
jgi:general secretion pathway protein H